MNDTKKKQLAWIIIVILAVCTIYTLAFHPAGRRTKTFEEKYPYHGLTYEQAENIIDDCNQHPDALRCQ